MIEIKVDLKKAANLFAQLALKAQNTQPAMLEVAGALFDSVEQNFIDGGRPKWQPLSKARIDQRSKNHKVHGTNSGATWPGDILVEWGHQGGLLGKMSSRATKDTAVVGNNAEYAAAMQLGVKGSQSVPSYRRSNGATVKGHTKQMNVPARPFLAIQAEDIKEAEAILLRHLLK